MPKAYIKRINWMIIWIPIILMR